MYQGPGRIEVATVADAAPAPGEVVVQVDAAGVCGTDHHLVAGELGVAAGMIPGHETAGRIAALGAGVDGWAVGDRVVCCGQVYCGACSACAGGHQNRCDRPAVFGVNRPGGFAQCVAVPAASLVALPDSIDAAIGAIATDAIATPFHALTAVGHLRAGETVVIVGTGGLGLHAVALARMMGAGRIVAVDTSAEARDLAAASGADDVFDPAAHERPGRALRALTGGAHVAFEFVGHAASVELGLDSVAAGGRLVVVGVGLERPRLPPVVRLVGMELTVSGSFGSTMAELEAVVTLLEQERIDVSRSVARHVGLDEAAAIFDTASGPGRTVIHPNGTGAGAHVGT